MISPEIISKSLLTDHTPIRRCVVRQWEHV